MSTNHTPNYGLCQWKAEDKVLRTDFNADNARIDASLSALAVSLDGKAATAALNALQSKVDSQDAALSGKGTCSVEVFTHTGNGNHGSKNPTVIQFKKKPTLCIVFGNQTYMIIVSGQAVGNVFRPGNDGSPVLDTCNCSWSGGTLKVYGLTPAAQANEASITYNVVAFYTA